MDYSLCDCTNCINWKNGRYTLKDPEKNGNSCLHCEEALDSLRLKADALKGTLR
jgi:hypothetical protein